MYRFEREVSFRTMADMMRGLPITNQIVRHYQEAVGAEIRIERAMSGSPICIRFVTRTESLDDWQRTQDKMAQDPAFHKLLGEFAPLIDGSRTNDRIWRE